MTLDPIVAAVVVPVEPAQAFVGFTAQMGEWWDPLLTPDAASFTSIEIDPEGDVSMAHGDERYAWGRVTAWEPVTRFAMDFWLGHEKASPTTLDVRFTEEAPGTTRVTLEHRGWADGMEGIREKYTHWDELLRRFSAHVS